jgi:hypothetical protein
MGGRPEAYSAAEHGDEGADDDHSPGTVSHKISEAVECGVDAVADDAAAAADAT